MKKSNITRIGCVLVGMILLNACGSDDSGTTQTEPVTATSSPTGLTGGSSINNSTNNSSSGDLTPNLSQTCPAMVNAIEVNPIQSDFERGIFYAYYCK